MYDVSGYLENSPNVEIDYYFTRTRRDRLQILFLRFAPLPGQCDI